MVILNGQRGAQGDVAEPGGSLGGGRGGQICRAGWVSGWERRRGAWGSILSRGGRSPAAQAASGAGHRLTGVPHVWPARLVTWGPHLSSSHSSAANSHMPLTSPAASPDNSGRTWPAPPRGCPLAPLRHRRTGTIVKLCLAPSRCIKLKCSYNRAPGARLNSQPIYLPNLLPGLDSTNAGGDSACRGL